MALSFFKKGKDKTPDAVQKPAPASAPVDTPSMLDMGSGMGSGGIVVEETSGAPQSPVDEAAIQYASGRADTAEHLLQGILTTGDRRAWHMLFDLYSVQNREKEFEKLALEYAMRFEASPPIWQRSGGSPDKPKQAEATSLELPSLLDKAAVDAMRQGIDGAPKNATVRIDFSHIAMIDEAGAEECAKILATARKTKRKLQIGGVDTLIALLQDLNRATHSREVHWLLLLELYQTLGKQDDFENLAVDYAVRFELSPPSWVEVQAAEVIQTKPAEPLDDAVRLSGEITPANSSGLDQVGAYAASHSEVLVDLSQVTRIDYESVSQVISVLMQCLGSGKPITLRGHNALIHELFRVMGIDQLCQLAPRHPA